jgi:O-antigen ligase
VLLPLLGFMGVSLLSFVFGQIPWLPVQPVSIMAQLGGLSIFLLLPGLFLYTIERLRSLRILKWTTWLFIALGGIFMATLLLPNMGQYGSRFFQRAAQDSMFWTWLVAITISQSLLNQKLRPIYRVALALVGLSVLYSTIVVRQAWISGWLPAVIAILTILMLKRPKWVLFGSLLLGVILIWRPEISGSIFFTGDNVYSLQTRLEAWKIMGELVRLNPVFGLGPATYHNYTPLFDILGYSVRFNSHNNYVDIAAQVGLLGLFFFLWFAWRLFWILRNNLDTMPDGFPRAFMYGALGGLIATLVSGLLGDWFLPFVYNVGLEGFRASSFAWFFLGAAVALHYIYHPGKVSEPRYLHPPEASSNRTESMRE